MPLPDIVSNLSTAQFRQYVLETLESIAGTTGQVAGLSNLSTAKFRQYMLGLLVEIAQNGGGGGGAPSGPAGGDLSATYPNPTVSKLLGRTLAIATPTNGQVLAWNATSSSWTPTSVSGTGTVTSITAGTGLSGGTITGSGTIALTTTGVTALSYGSSTQVAALTIDAYGRISAASNQAITPAGIGAQPALTTAAPLALGLGGTGSTTAASALSNLGGITSASLAGLATTTQLSAYQTALTSASPAAIAQGGTGATTAVAALSNLGGITSAALAGLASTSQLSGFQNSAQVQALASAQIAAITPASLGAVATSDIIGITKGGTGSTSAAAALSALGGITSAALSGFATTAQVSGLTSAQVQALTSAQIAALGTGLGAGQEWNATTTYKIGDVVTYGGAALAYVSLADNNINSLPYAGPPWQRVDANAISLQGYGISNSTPQNGQILKFQSGYDIWAPGDVSITSAQLPSNTLEAIGGAPLAEPYFTGYGPQGPTKSFGTNNNYLATTAFVRQNSSLFKFSPAGQPQEISVGTKYIFATDLSFIPKQAVLLYADSSNYMTGSIVSYNGSQLEINVTNAVGSGVYDITITVSPEVTGGGGGGGLDSAQVNALVTEQIAALGTGLGAGQVWNNTKTYSAGDVVTVSGTSNTYVSIQSNNTGNSPNAGFPWILCSTSAIQLHGRNILSTNPALGEALIWNGSAWAPAATAGAGTVTSVGIDTTGTGLTTGGTNPVTSSGTITIGGTLNVASGGTGATDAVSALSNLGAAPINSPAFTGTPTAPTAAANTNTTQVATTAFVMSNSGDRYLTTSTTSNTITNGTKTFTVASGLSYTATQDITIVYDANNHMHGSVTSYSGTTLVVDIVQHSQTSPGPYTQWTINVGGLTNTAGTLLSANNLSDVASTSTSLTNLGGVPTTRTISAGTGLSGGGDLTANRTLSLADTTVNAGSYGSSTQVAALTVDAQGRLTSASNITIPAGLTSAQVQALATQQIASITYPVSSIVNSTSAALTITQDGTGDALRVNDVSGDTSPFVIDASGRVTIGSTSGSYPLSIVGAAGTFKFDVVTSSSSVDIGSTNALSIGLHTNNTEKVRIDTSGNVGIGSQTFGAGASRVLAIASGSAPSTSPGSMFQMWSDGTNLLGRTPTGVVSVINPLQMSVSVFGASATWTKPTNAKRVRVQIWGGGGGGGGGARTASGTLGAGGGGGGSGSFVDVTFDANYLGATETVTIGSAGSGGASAATDSTNGGAGSAGGTTTFGSWLTAYGGANGSGGTQGATVTGTGGAGGFNGNSGSAASTTGGAGVGGVPANTTSTCGQANGSGASGGGIATTPANVGGGVGSRFLPLNITGATAGSAGGGAGNAGSTNITYAGVGIIGAGGGSGGGSNIAGAGGAGGVGGMGAGGGGGGACLNGAASGAGGAGGGGYAVITTYFN